jgi:xylose isomerase
MEQSANSSPEQTLKKAEKMVDYKILTEYVKSNYPIWKTDRVLKVVESWKNLPNSQSQFNHYASKLSSADLDRLFEGINASTVYR